MPEQRPSPMTIEEKIYAATRTPAPDPQFIAGLGARLAQQPAPARPALGARPSVLLGGLLRRPAWAAVLAVLVLLAALLLAAGPQRVLAALGGWFGYLPGVGLVEDTAGLRVLAEPAALARDGVTLTVEQAAADGQRTLVVIRVDGLSIQAANAQGEAVAGDAPAVLALPSGDILTQSGGDAVGWGSGYRARLVFPALPAGVEPTLMLARLAGMPAGAAPEDWRLPLRFMAAPSDLTVLPVYELQTPPGAASPTPAPSMAQAGLAAEAATATPDAGIALVLDRVVDTGDAYQLQGRITWDGQPYNQVGFALPDLRPFTLTDGAGQPVPYAWADSDPLGSDLSGMTWAIRTARKDYPGPWQLALARVQIDQALAEGEAGFQLDLGAGPQPGQSWSPDLPLTLAGRSVRLETASLGVSEHSGKFVLKLNFTGSAGVSGLSLIDPQNQPTGQAGVGGGGGGDAPAGSDGRFTASISYDALPTGLRQINVRAIAYRLPGEWSVQWQPPAAAAPTPTLPADAACLDAAAWEQLPGQPGNPPAGLGGRLLVETALGELMPRLSLVDPASGAAQDLVTGGWSHLSPDGRQVAFVQSQGSGVEVLDVASGAQYTVPNTLSDDYHPMWSPDGQRLAFVRGSQGIFTIRADGSDLQAVVDGARIRSLAGWLPDGSGLVITSLQDGGSQVQTVDLASGQIQDRFLIQNLKGGFPQLSPDGGRIAYNETVFGQSSYGVYVANLDGSERRLLAGLDGATSVTGAWSPDGRWLALAISRPDGARQTVRTVLVNVDQCALWPVPAAAGHVSGWAIAPQD